MTYIPANSDDRRSEGRECHPKGSKRKTCQQVRRENSSSLEIHNCTLSDVAAGDFCCSAFDAERERQHRAKHRQMEVKRRKADVILIVCRLLET